MKKFIFVILGIILLSSCVERTSSQIEEGLSERIQKRSHVVTITKENDDHEMETHEYLVYGGYDGYDMTPFGHWEGCSYCKNKNK